MSGEGTTVEAAPPARALLLRLADLPATPWKNGGGTTVEYAVRPAGAGLADFEWRVSRARVAEAGPFSNFPDVDRTLAVVEGDGIDLVFADRREHLGRFDPPLAFPGDVAVDGRPTAGPIVDLNVMTRRGRWSHRVERRKVEGSLAVALDGATTFVVAGGALRVVLGEAEAFDLAPGDALRLDGPTALVLEAPRPTDALVARLHPSDEPGRP